MSDNSPKEQSPQEDHSKVKASQDDSSSSSTPESNSESSRLSNTRSGDNSSDSNQQHDKLKTQQDVSYEWRTFKMPTVPPPDDSQIEAELNQHYDITALFQQMRSVS